MKWRRNSGSVIVKALGRTDMSNYVDRAEAV
jgi:hypothetical protein